MNIRAAIFDVYSTILEVGPPPANAEALWQRLFEEALDVPPPLNRTEFSIRSSQVVARLHSAAKARGIPWPEIHWPAVVLEVIPAVARLPAPRQEDFVFRQMQIGRALRLADGAAKCLRHLHERGILLGIASNAQAYTLRELADALQPAGLSLSCFDRELCFWSFENGFSKPDPHVVRILTARLEARGLRPARMLLVGDRLDNDIAPARAFGWQTWHLSAPPRGEYSGSWRDLLAWLKRSD